MKISESFSTLPATATVSIGAGLSSIVNWLDIINKAMATTGTLIAVICGCITLYGHFRRWKNGKHK